MNLVAKDLDQFDLKQLAGITKKYCNRRNFHMRFNFVRSADSMTFSGIRKPCTYTSVCDTTLAVRNLWRTEVHEG